jgi:hypothetical protein
LWLICHPCSILQLQKPKDHAFSLLMILRKIASEQLQKIINKVEP